jgi:hypothetical protein
MFEGIPRLSLLFGSFFSDYFELVTRSSTFPFAAREQLAQRSVFMLASRLGESAQNVNYSN